MLPLDTLCGARDCVHLVFFGRVWCFLQVEADCPKKERRKALARSRLVNFVGLLTARF